jgi:hypothetical protein
MDKDKTLCCDLCDKEFEVSYSSWVNRRRDKRDNNTNIYCGIDCRLKARSHSPKVEVSCEECKTLFLKSQSEINKTKNHFCSRSCSATYNNKHHQKKIKTKQCNCGELIYSNLKYCPTCITDGKHLRGEMFMKDRTLGEELSNGRTDANRYNNIRCNARKNMKELPKVCYNCSYDKHVEVCHKRAIKDFPNTALISEINSKDNLIYLCRNCHWEFDHGIKW